MGFLLFRVQIQAGDAARFRVDHRGKFPALYLENNAEQLDAAFPAFLDEFTVIHESIKLHPGIHRPKGFVFQVRQADAAAAQPRPDEHIAVVFFQILQHLKAAKRKRGMIAMIVFHPSIKIDASVHDMCLLSPVVKKIVNVFSFHDITMSEKCQAKGCFFI